MRPGGITGKVKTFFGHSSERFSIMCILGTSDIMQL